MFAGRRAPQMSGRTSPRRTEAQILGIFEGSEMCAEAHTSGSSRAANDRTRVSLAARGSNIELSRKRGWGAPHDPPNTQQTRGTRSRVALCLVAVGVPASHPNDMFAGRCAPQMSGHAGPRRTEAQMLGIFEGGEMCAEAHTSGSPRAANERTCVSLAARGPNVGLGWGQSEQ